MNSWQAADPPSHPLRRGHRATWAPPQDIRDAVNAELKFDPLVDDADIHVVNVNGDVALNGTVPSYPQYLEAAAAAQRVGGVKNVQNHLEVVLPDEDFRDDAMLTTAANNALTLNVTVPDGVEAHRAGRQPDADRHGGLRQRARRRRTGGLRADRRPQRQERHRDRLRRRGSPIDVDLHVQEALDRSALVPDDSDVEVAAKGGTITLTGHVRTWAEHDAVIGAAWMARGVIDVRDDLQITG